MSYSSEVLADSPWGYWKCDETSGTTLADSSGNTRSMTFPAGAPTLAQSGPNGAADAIAWPSSAGGTEYYAVTSVAFGTSNVTYEAWVYLTANPSAQTAIVACGASYGVGGTDKYAYIGTDGKVRFYIFNGGQATYTASSALTLNAWNHVVVSCGAAGTKIRVNKSTVASSGNTGTTSGTPKLFIHGGGIDGTGGNAVDVTNSNAVTIAEVSVYTSQLSDARTDAHYDAMFPPTAAGSLSFSGSAGGAAAGAASGSLAFSGSATSGLNAVGTGSLSLSGSAGAGGALVAAGSLSLSGSAAGAAHPGAAGSITFSSTAEAHPLYTTDMSNVFTGLSMAWTATVSYSQAVTATPAGTTRGTRVDKAVPLPLPTLVNGRPT